MRIMFVQGIAAAVFAVGTWIQVSALLFQISDKKRQLSSFVAYVNLVSMTTYVGHLCGWLQPVYGWNGLPLQMRYIEWISATPIMLMCLSALGSSMQDALVQDWNLTAKTMIWDVVMVNCGLLHSAIVSETLGWIACGVGCFAGVMVFYGVHQLTIQSVANAATTHEVVSLRSLEYFTYALWAFFPMIHIACKAGFIDYFQEEIAMAIMDVVAKQVYSVTLLTGNFCIMDTVATLRLDQIQADRDETSNKVLRAEIMNRALQTQVVEAETSARLSRLFLANISHELRTPLNSVIAFNSLILEDGGLTAIHQDYLRSSLTSAEALLGVINQVLEYAKLETQEDDNSLHMVDLDTKPFCLRQLCDELCDIVTSRVNTRGADFALDNSCLWSPGVPHVLVGDSFRLRQCLINLCDNGIKFSRDEGGQVRLRIELVETKFPRNNNSGLRYASIRRALLLLRRSLSRSLLTLVHTSAGGQKTSSRKSRTTRDRQLRPRPMSRNVGVLRFRTMVLGFLWISKECSSSPFRRFHCTTPHPPPSLPPTHTYTHAHTRALFAGVIALRHTHTHTYTHTHTHTQTHAHALFADRMALRSPAPRH